jgi:hypothetical protein
MQAPWRSRTAVIAFSIAAILSWSGSAWADTLVGVPEPTATPGPDNDYNVTTVSPGDSPLREGDTVTFTSSSDITDVQVTGGSAGAPYRTGGGNTNVDVKITRWRATAVVTYKSGKKRGVILVTGVKTLAVRSFWRDRYGYLYVGLKGTRPGSATEVVIQRTYFSSWLPEDAPSAAPVKEVGSNTEGQRGAGSTTGGTGGTTTTTPH